MHLREISTELSSLRANEEFLKESIAELELALEDVGWRQLRVGNNREFSASGLRNIRAIARLFFIKNPLIQNACRIQSNYVWGQGFSVNAETEIINDVIQMFMDDPKNTSSFTGHAAKLELERALLTQGDIFAALFTNASNGRVIVRTIHPDEIDDIITDPDDSKSPWFYKRVWQESAFDPKSGIVNAVSQTRYYPDWRIVNDKSVQIPNQIGGFDVAVDSPIYHIKVGGFGDMRFGIPEVYAALDWARAVTNNLADHSSILKAHTRFAAKLTTKGGPLAVSAAKKRLATTLNADGAGSRETNPPSTTGATFIGSKEVDWNPIKFGDALPDPETSGRPLRLMVSAATGIPETILMGNADVGNLATAKTLDRPTELQMSNRQTLWSGVYADILNYVIDAACRAPNGKLAKFSHPEQDDYLGLERWVIDDPDATESGPADRTISVTFPSILHHDTLQLVQAIVEAATLGGKPTAGLFDDRTVARMLLGALGEDNTDEILDILFEDEEPSTDAGTTNAGIQPEQDMGDMGPTLPSTSIGISPDLAIVASMRALREAVKLQNKRTVRSA
jgi:hypothetical protein